MDLFSIPLVFALIAAFAPKNLVGYVSLTGAFSSLIAACVHVAYYTPGWTVVLFEPKMITNYGLTFKMGYDGLGLLMVLFVKVVILLLVVIVSVISGKLKIFLVEL